MKSALIAFVSLLFLAHTAEAETFQDVLTRAGVIRVVRGETTSFVREFSQMTQVTPEVGTNFNENMAERVSNIEVETPASAEATLRVRFRLFLANMTSFLLATHQKLVFDLGAVTKYMDAAGQVGRCGEVPCQRPCNIGPCDIKCNACPPPVGR